jgi:hypothetical protein
LRSCADNYRQFSTERVQRRLAWWEANHQRLDICEQLPREAYTLVVLIYMGLDPREVPMVSEDDKSRRAYAEIYERLATAGVSRRPLRHLPELEYGLPG